MTAADVAAVTDIEYRTFSDPWSADSFEYALETDNQYFLVAEENGRIAGYCGMLYVLDEGQIMNVAVDTQFRRRGVARSLLEALMNYGDSRALTVYTLEVRDGNAPARALYESMGFKPVGRRKGYYQHPTEDAILMELSKDAQGGDSSLQ